jgi:hypothetical protein
MLDVNRSTPGEDTAWGGPRRPVTPARSVREGCGMRHDDTSYMEEVEWSLGVREGEAQDDGEPHVFVRAGSRPGPPGEEDWGGWSVAE